MRATLLPSLLALVPLLLGCPRMAAPPSQLPTADAALERLHQTQRCGYALGGGAKIDHFGREGRVRGQLLFFAARPASLRLDIVSPFGVNLATLTADPQRFALADLREKHFYFGPADPCNIARLTTVPIPGHAFVSLLVGDAPVLAHDAARLATAKLAPPTIAWDTHGYYVVHVQSTRNATQTLHLAVHPGDLQKPWSAQRIRLVDLLTEQSGGVLYHAELEDHAPIKMSGPRVDPDGIDAPMPPSGPECTAELPRTIHLEVPGSSADVLFRFDDAAWNPALPAGAFQQERPAGTDSQFVTCPDHEPAAPH
jgi:hypothetical protein